MDEKQKDLLRDGALFIASTVEESGKFEELAMLLLDRKLVSEERVKEIKILSTILDAVLLFFLLDLLVLSFLLDHCCQTDAGGGHISLMTKLIWALMESDSPTAFDEFIQILEALDNQEALELLVLNKKQPSATRSMMKRLADKFVQSTSKSNQYPLGMNSSVSNASAPSQSTGLYTDYRGDPPCSRLKEKHQATLITSATSTNVSPQNISLDSGFKLIRKCLTPISKPILDRGSTAPPSFHENINLRDCIQNFASQQSQSTTVQRELTNMRDLSLTDRQESLSENGEPLVTWSPYTQPRNQDGSRASSPHCCHPSCSSASSESEYSSDSLLLDPKPILNSSVTMAIAKDGTNMMAVKTTTVLHNNPESDYKMTARPRGPCLIVNNIDFEGEIFPTRKGSDEDARRFDSIFQQLGFTVIMRRNQTADEMRQLFKDVAAECKREHDALFVFILSHGSEHGIYGTDGMEVSLEQEILPCFDNRNCKAMLGKPKVFVIQACRGRGKDYGSDGDMTDSIAWSPAMLSPGVKVSSQDRVPNSWLPSQDGKKRKHPIRTDMLLVFSCLAGFVSVRNELAGSWLGVALAYFIMTHSHERHLLQILNLVTMDVIQRESSHGHIQSIEVKLLGWTKDLYLNPGIYV